MATVFAEMSMSLDGFVADPAGRAGVGAESGVPSAAVFDSGNYVPPAVSDRADRPSGTNQ